MFGLLSLGRHSYRTKPNRAPFTRLLFAAAVLAGCQSLPVTMQAELEVDPLRHTAPGAPSGQDTESVVGSVPQVRDAAYENLASAAMVPALALATTDATGAAAKPPEHASAVATNRLTEVEAAALSTLFARVRAGFALPSYEHPAINRIAGFYARKRVLDRTEERARLYLYHFVVEAERRGLPSELALLPYVESAYNPRARSHAGAVGICQFMPATGRRFGLAQSAWVDLRRDPIRCARAMYDYLEENYRRFGDWFLALAAYNAGEGAVSRAIAKNTLKDKPTDYASLELPQETQLYVPALLGLKRLIEQPEAFGQSLPELPNRPSWITVNLTRDIDTGTAARFAGVSAETFQALNPALNKPVIPRSVLPDLVLPADAAARFRTALDLHSGPLSSWTAYRVERTANVEQLAKSFKLEPAMLRQLNNIPLRHRVVAGSTLLVPRAGLGSTLPPEISEQIARDGVVATTPEPLPARAITRKKRAQPHARGQGSRRR